MRPHIPERAMRVKRGQHARPRRRCTVAVPGMWRIAVVPQQPLMLQLCVDLCVGLPPDGRTGSGGLMRLSCQRDALDHGRQRLRGRQGWGCPRLRRPGGCQGASVRRRDHDGRGGVGCPDVRYRGVGRGVTLTDNTGSGTSRTNVVGSDDGTTCLLGRRGIRGEQLRQTGVISEVRVDVDGVTHVGKVRHGPSHRRARCGRAHQHTVDHFLSSRHAGWRDRRGYVANVRS